MTEPRKDWWGRNWKWFVPVLCLAAFLMFAAFVGMVFAGYALMTRSMRSSGAYQTAVATAKADPRVLAALGTPIKEGFLMNGHIGITRTWPGPATEQARFAIPISGPKGKGTILVRATKSGGQWTFSRLEVRIEATGEEIDLKEKPADQERTDELLWRVAAVI